MFRLALVLVIVLCVRIGSAMTETTRGTLTDRNVNMIIDVCGDFPGWRIISEQNCLLFKMEGFNHLPTREQLGIGDELYFKDENATVYIIRVVEKKEQNEEE